MNFFQHQEAARKKTGRLVILFALAVAAQGHLWRPLGWPQRALCALAGISLTFPDIVDDWVGGLVAARLLGLFILAVLVWVEFARSRKAPSAPA